MKMKKRKQKKMKKVTMNEKQQINDVQNAYVDQVHLQQLIQIINQMIIMIHDVHVVEYT